MNHNFTCGGCLKPNESKYSTRLYCYGCYRTMHTTGLARRAHRAVSAAVKAGKLPRAATLSCADCGSRARDYDHRDYTKPLQVQAVCRGCNVKRGPALNPVSVTTAEQAA